MKKTLVLSSLLFSILFSPPSYSEWKWELVGESVNGNTFYVDFEGARKHDGYVYFWRMSNYLKPTPSGKSSSKGYIKGDCKIFRQTDLSGSFHKEAMGKGASDTYTLSPSKQEWSYPSPNSVSEVILKRVCSR